MKKSLLFIFGLAASLSSFAQWTHLSHTQLSNVSPAYVIYTGTSALIGTDGGIFRSTDNGLNWQCSNSGIDSTSIRVTSLLLYKNQPWMCNGYVYKSANNGQTWSKVSLNGVPNAWINGIAKVKNRLFLINSEWNNNTQQNFSVLYYSDNGTNWTAGDTLSKGNKSGWYQFLSSSNDSLYLVEGNSQKLYSSADGTKIFDFPSTGLQQGTQFDNRYLSIDSTGKKLFFANSGNNNVYKFNFTSKTWEVKMNGITAGAAGLGGVYNVGNTTFTSAYYMGTSLSINLFSSTNDGDNWTPITNNGGISYPIFDYGVARIGSSRLIASDVYKNLYYSDNEGQNWTVVKTIMSGDYSKMTQTNNGNLFAVQSNVGIITSSDNGTTWTVKNGDLTPFQGNLYFAKQIEARQTVLYLTYQATPFDEKADLYTSTNSGTNWTKITAPDSVSKTILCFHGAYPLFSFMNKNNQGTYQFYNGAAWVNITSGITATNMTSVSGFCSDGDTLFLAGRDNNGNYQLFWSTNNGTSFSSISNGLITNKTSILIANENSSGNNDPQFPIIAFGNNTNNPIAAARDDNGMSMYKFFRLNAAKDGWEAISNTGINILNGNINVRYLKQQGNVWYFVTDFGVYASSDGCATWELVWGNQGLQTGMQNFKFFVRNNYLFLGTSGTGIWRTQITTPVLSTGPITNIKQTTADGGGNITSKGGIPFNMKGICWGTSQNPTIANDTTVILNSSFDGSLKNLLPNTTYHVRAFVVNPLFTAYGGDIQFTTNNTTGIQSVNGSENFSIFPNPANDNLYILSNAKGNVEITIININGQVVYKETKEGTTMMTLNVSNLNSGIYSVQIKSDIEVKTSKIQIIK